MLFLQQNIYKKNIMSDNKTGKRTYFDDSTVALGTIFTVLCLVLIAALVIFG